jgi:hypothetical protein
MDRAAHRHVGTQATQARHLLRRQLSPHCLAYAGKSLFIVLLIVAGRVECGEEREEPLVGAKLDVGTRHGWRRCAHWFKTHSHFHRRQQQDRGGQHAADDPEQTKRSLFHCSTSL